jgi:Fe-S cluster assembly protein SufD
MNQLPDIQNYISDARRGRSSLSMSAEKRRVIHAERACELGIPSMRDEEWKYTNPKLLHNGLMSVGTSSSVQPSPEFDSVLHRHRIPESIRLVLFEGDLLVAESDLKEAQELGLNVIPARDAENGDDVLFDRMVVGGDRFFARLACASSVGGLLIRCPAALKIPKSLHILHVVGSRKPLMMQSIRHLIAVETDAQLSIVEEFVGLDQTLSHTNSLTQIVAFKGAHCSYSRIVSDFGDHLLTSHVGIEVHEGSDVRTFSYGTAGRLSRLDLHIEFKGRKASAFLGGLYGVSKNHVIDHHTVVDHRVPECISRQNYRGILTDQGRGVFNGKVFIRSGASGTEAYQSNKNICLSNDAEMNTKPELCIDHDQVKASHGATVGSLNDLELFYLRSRGLSESVAKELLLRGFAQDVLHEIADANLRTYVEQCLAAWFSTLKADTPIEVPV